MLGAVSSEAMLGGQKSPYKLLVRAVNQHTGAEVPFITFLASEDFVVRCPATLPMLLPCPFDCRLVGSCQARLGDVGAVTFHTDFNSKSSFDLLLV